MRVLIVASSIGVALLFSCGETKSPEEGTAQPAVPGPEPAPAPTPAPTPAPEPAPIDPEFQLEILDEQEAAAATAATGTAAPTAAAALMPSNGTGCAPGTRCIRVTQVGKPSATGTSIAQCSGKFPDFIVASSTVPSGYAGPWFQPNPIESANIGVPQGTRPWRAFDPRDVGGRLKYLLALRNYAFSSAIVRGLTPTLTANSDYEDASAGTVPANQRPQKWYPAPRMIYGGTTAFGVREAAFGMTRERPTGKGTLGGNTERFDNFAVGYYDARGARTFARTWKATTPGVDTVDLTKMKFTKDGLVFKLLYSAAKPTDFPTDILDGSLKVTVLPNANGSKVDVRLLQIDIAVKDERAGPTGWYFATYAYDRSIAGSSPWLKMTPVGLMWGNDPAGPPLTQSWINPGAPAYAAAHVGFEGRLNGPVDNPTSACMSCHSTAQAPTLANMTAEGNCASQKPSWFRNLSGTTAFGRFDQNTPGCDTTLSGAPPVAADYSLQLSATVTKATTGPAEFNPCTWDTASVPAGAGAITSAAAPARQTIFPVER